MPSWLMSSGIGIGAAVAKNYTTHLPFLGGMSVTGVTEANNRMLCRESYTASLFYIRIVANATSATAATFTSRKNASAGNMSISVAVGTTGAFQESTPHTDSLSNGDYYGLRIVNGDANYTITPSIVSIVLTGTNPIIGACPAGSTTPGVSIYPPIPGASSASTETNGQYLIRVRTVLSNMYFCASSNTITAASTVVIRIDGANGNQTVSVPGLTAGIYEDTTNTDDVAAGKYLGTKITGGAGGTSINLNHIQFKATSVSRITGGAAGNVTAYSPATSYYCPLEGNPNYASTTEANAQLLTRIPVTFKNLLIKVSTNTVNGTSTYKTRISGADGSLTVSVNASTTGFFEDTANTDVLASTDTYNYLFAVGGSTGSQNIIIAGVLQIGLDVDVAGVLATATSQAEVPAAITGDATVSAVLATASARALVPSAWLPNYTYRKAITIAHSDDAAQSNYQMLLTVFESGITSSVLESTEHSATSDFANSQPYAPAPHSISPAVNIPCLTRANGYLQIDLKCNNPSLMHATDGQLELTSSGDSDTNELGIGTAQLVAATGLSITSSYQTFRIPLSAFQDWGGAINLQSINYIRWYHKATAADITIYWRNASIICTALSLEAHSADFSTLLDLRISTDDGITLCDHWLESISGSSPYRIAKVWIEVPTIAAHPDDTTIFAYYGYSGASDYSSITATFPHTQHFPGSTAPSGWYTQGTVAVANSEIQVGPGESAIADTTGSHTTARWRLKTKCSSNANFVSLCGLQQGADPWTTLLHIYSFIDYSDVIFLADNKSGRASVVTNLCAFDTSYHVIQFARSGANVKVWFDDALVYTGTDAMTEAAWTSLFISAGTAYATWDWMVIADYTLNEPTFSAYGTEAKSVTVSATLATATSQAEVPAIAIAEDNESTAMAATAASSVPTLSLGTDTSPPLVEATTSAQVPAITGDANVAATLAAATTLAEVPVINCDIFVTGFVATATTQAEVPAITIAEDNESTALAATAEMLVPDIVTATPVEISATLATATTQAEVPAITIAEDTESTALAATAEMPVPVITGDATTAATLAVAVADAPAPALSLSITIDAPQVDATAQLHTPAIDFDYTISADIATATTGAGVPAIEISTEILATTAAASAELLAPFINIVPVLIEPPQAAAGAGQAAPDLLVVALPTTQTATGAALDPTVTGTAIITPPTATALAIAEIPSPVPTILTILTGSYSDMSQEINRVFVIGVDVDGQPAIATDEAGV